MNFASPRTVVYLDHTAKWSGGEIALLRTLSAVSPSHVRAVVLLAEDGPFADRLREMQVETHILPLMQGAREVRKGSLTVGAALKQFRVGFSFLGYAHRVARFVREQNADIIHCNSLKADVYGAVAGRLARVPVLWHIRDHISPGYLPPQAVRVFRKLAQTLPFFLIANSVSTLDTLFAPDDPNAAKRRKTCRVVYDGLRNDELTTPAPLVTGKWKHNPPRIGIVGRLVEWKGQHIFLEAAALLQKRGVSARFVVIGAALFGEAEYAASLKTQAGVLGPDAVEFTGFQTDVPALLRDLDILVHASTTPEPFGQVVIEGMAEGLPVVASDGGGVREIITHGVNGILTPMGDASALADALQTLLTDPAKAQTMAQAAWAHIRKSFTAEQSARSMEAVYDVIGKATTKTGRDGTPSAAVLETPQGDR